MDGRSIRFGRRGLLLGASAGAFGLALGDAPLAMADPAVTIPVGTLAFRRRALIADQAVQVRSIPEHSGGTVLARYFRTVKAIADAVGADGWITGDKWRPAAQLDRRNARVMEQVAILAYFYGLDEPWNAAGWAEAGTTGDDGFCGNSVLAERLDLALRYYYGLQYYPTLQPEASDTDKANRGAFPEGSNKASFAATGFGVSSLVFAHMSKAPDPVLATSTDPTRSVQTAIRDAVFYLLTVRETSTSIGWVSPVDAPAPAGARLQYTNQFIGAIVAVVDALIAFPALRNEFADDLTKRIADLEATGFALSGHSNESRNYDFGYSFEVALPDLAYLRRRLAVLHLPDFEAQQTVVSNMAIRMMRFIEKTVFWEPSGTVAFHYAGISVRTRASTYVVGNDIAFDDSALARDFDSPTLAMAPYFMTSKTFDDSIAVFRRAGGTSVAELPSDGASPRRLIHRPYVTAPKSEADRSAQFGLLPYHGPTPSSTFCYDETGLVYGFIRRDGYAIGCCYDVSGASSGALSQRFGPGIAWTRRRGTFIWAGNAAVANPIDTWGCVGDGYIEGTRHLGLTVSEGLHASGGTIPAGPTGTSTTTGNISTKSPGPDPSNDTIMSYAPRNFYRELTAASTLTHSTPFLLLDDDEVTFGNGEKLVRGDQPFTTSIAVSTMTIGNPRINSSIVLTLNAPRTLTMKRNGAAIATGAAIAKTQWVLTFPFVGRLGVNIAVVEP